MVERPGPGHLISILGVAAFCAAGPGAGAADPPSQRSLFRTVDLNTGESEDLELSDGSRVRVKLLGVEEVRDSIRSAIREARAQVTVNGEPVTIESGNYRLPAAAAGVQLDCPVTKGYYKNCDPFEDSWGLDKDARLRLWPVKSPWTPPGSFVYPARQRWFASATQMANEQSFVDGGDAPDGRPIYYHSGLDIGVCEGLVEAVAASDGLVVSAGGDALVDFVDVPFYRRASYDTVYVLGDNGWLFRYAHLKTIDPRVRPGQRVTVGQTLALVGKEGSSGGWSHLHFDIKARQPSGKWGIQEAYAFLWEAYRRDFHPDLIAMARPHRLARVGELVSLDGSRSWSSTGAIASYEWLLGDGSMARGARIERRYDRPGMYSEILRVTDDRGRVDHDFGVVQVLGKEPTDPLPPTIHASCAPASGVRAGDVVTFKVRTFRSAPGDETWDFGDGSARVSVHSDGNLNSLDPEGYAETLHRFFAPGLYIVRVEGKARDGARAVAHLRVEVGEAAPVAVKSAPTAWEEWLDRKVLPEVEARWMMRGFLERQLQPIAPPETREAWIARRETLRREVLEVLGLDDLLPPQWDLALRSRGVLQREGYRIEKVTFQSYPGLTIPALVYVPDGISGRVPGIVSISGHTDISKAADYVQQRNVNLALRGCVVISYDYFGYGERRTGPIPGRPTGANGHDNSSFSFSRRSATTLEALDAVRAVDALVSRPEVDAGRLGITGESGGSNTCYWLAAIDPRICLVVPVSSVTTFDYWIRTDRNWDWHQRPPGIRRIADIGTLLALHAPDPLLVVSSHRRTDDEEFPLEEAEKSYQWAKRVYRWLGAEDAVAHHESATAHGYQEDKREQLYGAVERWLKPPSPKGAKEQPVRLEAVDDLQCGLPDGNLTFRDVFDGWLKPLPRVDAAFDSDALRAFLRARLGLPATPHAPKAQRTFEHEQDPWFVENWILETEPGIRLPAVRIGAVSGREVAARITLIPGRAREAVARALAGGRQVLALDLRGTGEMRFGTDGHWAAAAGPQWQEILGEAGGRLSNWAWLAGRPWPGMWALDLQQAARFCRDQLGASAVEVDAAGLFGWPALLAGAADPALIAAGTVELRLTSLQDNVRARGRAALADVPGLLERLDIPRIIELWPGGQTKLWRQ